MRSAICEVFSSGFSARGETANYAGFTDDAAAGRFAVVVASDLKLLKSNRFPACSLRA